MLCAFHQWGIKHLVAKLGFGSCSNLSKILKHKEGGEGKGAKTKSMRPMRISVIGPVFRSDAFLFILRILHFKSLCWTSCCHRVDVVFLLWGAISGYLASFRCFHVFPRFLRCCYDVEHGNKNLNMRVMPPRI